jgi:hypothetical protein
MLVEVELFVLILIGFGGIILKAYQLFGKPNKRKI